MSQKNPAQKPKKFIQIQKHVIDLGGVEEEGSQEKSNKLLNTAGSSSLAEIIRTINFEQQQQKMITQSDERNFTCQSKYKEASHSSLAETPFLQQPQVFNHNKFKSLHHYVT